MEGERKEAISKILARGYCSKKVAGALLRIPRENFVPENLRTQAYADSPLPIGFGQTISAISIVAYMLERAGIEKGANILEIGTGSGYQTALLSLLAGKKGKITSIETIPELIDFAKKNIKKTILDAKNIQIILGDGTLGYKKNSPYGRVIVTAASPQIPPPLISQLAPKGRLLIPIGTYYQDLILYDNKTKEKESLLSVVFVPLVGKHGFKKG